MPSCNLTRAGAPAGVIGTGSCRRSNEMHTYSMPSFTKISTPPSSRKSLHPKKIFRTRITASHSRNIPTATTATSDTAVDLCIVGAGIIGLTVASTLLESDPDITVLLLDRYEPCLNSKGSSTGAGQGYIWLAHRDPSSVAWEIATRSKILLENSVEIPSSSPSSFSSKEVPYTQESLEWQNLGSMLLATTAEETATLQLREIALRTAGIEANFINAAAARSLEPSVYIPDDGGALLTPGDSQLNGHRTAVAVLEACKAHGPRFSAAFYEGVEKLNIDISGKVCGVSTEKERTILVNKGVVLASGAWAGEFLAHQLSQPGWANALRPRRGLLLEMPRPLDMPPLNRGLMEMGYTKHYSIAGKAAAAKEAALAAGEAAKEGVATSTNIETAQAKPPPSPPDITFAATTSASGSLLIGSSREFSGWDVDAVPEVVDSIMSRAMDFLPGLSSVDRKSISTRVGLRPFAAGGTMVGPVPGVEGLLLASGHEGSGLTLSKVTGELIADYLLDRKFALSEAAVASLLPKLPVVP